MSYSISSVAVVGACLLAFSCGTATAATGVADRNSKTRRLVNAFADCAVRNSAPVARAVILGNLNNKQVVRAAYRLLYVACVHAASNKTGVDAQAIKFEGDSFRFALAQALVRKDYPDEIHFDFSTVPALGQWELDTIKLDAVDGSRKDRKKAEVYNKRIFTVLLSRYGECVVRKEPDSVLSLLRTSPDSPGETEGIRALTTALTSCLTGKVAFGKDVLRGLLALNFYRLAGPPAGASVASLKVVS